MQKTAKKFLSMLLALMTVSYTHLLLLLGGSTARRVRSPLRIRCTVLVTWITPFCRSISLYCRAHSSPRRKPVFSVSKIAIPVVVGSTTIFCANRWISSGQNMSICFLRYAGNSTVRPGQEQPAFGALYFRMDFNNTPTSLALFPERPFF